jgi:penicillin-binding protein 1A
MASAYATLASGGIRHEPQAIERVEFPNGDVERFGQSDGKRVLTDGEAYEVTDILADNIESGTGTGANIGCSGGQAGKTGTTDEFKDAWFVGYTPNLSTSVWVGYPDVATPTGIAGGDTPATIWNSFMSVANGECETFPQPTEPAQLTALVSDNTSSTSSDSSYDAPEESTEPVIPEPGTYDPDYYESPPLEPPEP